MPLGKVIRKYRKVQHLTQEEVAERLGVTASAVNKWENEISYPDITLLAPIARLFGISLNTLLSFQEELTAAEIELILREANEKIKTIAYDEAFQWGKKKLEEYPNCEQLLLQMAMILESGLILQDIPKEKTTEYEDYFCSLYLRALNSGETPSRVQAADRLVSHYMKKKQYEKAEKYLEYFSIQNPERKRKQAEIYAKMGRTEEAYQAYEELLFSDYQRVSLELNGIYMLALQENNKKKAREMVEKQKQMAICFEMGEYYEYSCELDFATVEKDADRVIAAMEKMLSCVERIGEFKKSKLYEHMNFRQTEENFAAELKENLLQCFRDDESYGFLKHDDRWIKLTEQKEENKTDILS